MAENELYLPIKRGRYANDTESLTSVFKGTFSTGWRDIRTNMLGVYERNASEQAIYETGQGKYIPNIDIISASNNYKLRAQADIDLNRFNDVSHLLVVATRHKYKFPPDSLEAAIIPISDLAGELLARSIAFHLSGNSSVRTMFDGIGRITLKHKIDQTDPIAFVHFEGQQEDPIITVHGDEAKSSSTVLLHEVIDIGYSNYQILD